MPSSSKRAARTAAHADRGARQPVPLLARSRRPRCGFPRSAHASVPLVKPRRPTRAVAGSSWWTAPATRCSSSACSAVEAVEGPRSVMLTVLGIVTVFRLMPPDWTRAFRNSTAVWRPSAYDPQSNTPASRSGAQKGATPGAFHPAIISIGGTHVEKQTSARREHPRPCDRWQPGRFIRPGCRRR